MSSCTGGKSDNEKLDLDDLKVSFPGKFTYKDLHKLGFIEFEHAEENDLTEPVLELFCNWKDLNGDERVVLDPVLRLASMMIRSSASVRFIHNVMYGKRTYLRTESMLSKCAIYELALPPCYSRKTFDQFVDGLDDLQRLVKWNVADLPEGIAAETITIFEEPRPFRGCGIDIKWGFSTNIVVERKVFQSLHELQLCAQSTSDKTTRNEVSVRSHKLRLQYWLAVTLCHELVHAINQAVSEDREPFYGNQKYAELGYAWENDCLGGRLMSLRGFRGPDPFITVKWPSLNLIPPEDSEETGRGHPKGSATQYYVPMDYMAHIQRQQTWDAYASPDQAPLNALYIPKLVGVQSHDKKQKMFDPLWRRAESSEGRWPGGRHGRVWRAAYLKERVADSITVEESSELSLLLERTPTSPDSVSHTVVSSLTDAVERLICDISMSKNT
ncbi:hypothetical protein MMC14_000586 [Varicellaria rhodocarpa]|nr:hypothetical protein [Varicellaria rhodocarpa]